MELGCSGFANGRAALKRAPYKTDPAAWDRSQRHAYDVRSFDPISHGEDLEVIAKPWERAMFLLAGLFLGLSLATAYIGA